MTAGDPRQAAVGHGQGLRSAGGSPRPPLSTAPLQTPPCPPPPCPHPLSQPNVSAQLPKSSTWWLGGRGGWVSQWFFFDIFSPSLITPSLLLLLLPDWCCSRAPDPALLQSRGARPSPHSLQQLVVLRRGSEALPAQPRPLRGVSAGAWRVSGAGLRGRPRGRTRPPQAVFFGPGCAAGGAGSAPAPYARA